MYYKIIKMDEKFLNAFKKEKKMKKRITNALLFEADFSEVKQV